MTSYTTYLIPKSDISIEVVGRLSLYFLAVQGSRNSIITIVIIPKKRERYIPINLI
jgi:hypothetical protein